VALHHKDYSPRTKGPCSRPKQTKQLQLQLPVPHPQQPKKEPSLLHNKIGIPTHDEGHDYGLVLRILGGSRFIVFCYSNCSEKLCRMSGKLKFRKIWIYRGDIVLMRLRNYQDSKADIIYKYSEKEYQYLVNIGELNPCDPKNLLTNDVYQKLLTYLDCESRSNLEEATHWKFCQCPIPKPNGGNQT